MAGGIGKAVRSPIVVYDLRDADVGGFGSVAWLVNLVGVGGGKGKPAFVVACLIGVFGGSGKLPGVIVVRTGVFKG